MEGQPKQKLESQEALSELTLQTELRESGEYAYAPSASHWYWNMVDGKPFSDTQKAELLLAQKDELPYLVSALLERTCNLRCAHCIYQDEQSSRKASEEGQLAAVVEHIIRTMPQGPAEQRAKFMSAGRILRPWHLDIFKKLRESRPDVQLGVIDNGTYTKLLRTWPEGLQLDWLDISVDGTEANHDKQRGESSYAAAMEGLRHAREITRSREEGGYVASLLTLTNINAGDVLQVANTLLNEKAGEPLADKLNLTTMGPTNAINARLEISQLDFAQAWDGLKEACAKYNTPGNERVSLGLYRVEDVEKLAAVVGEGKFLESFPADEDKARERVTFRGNFVETHVDGVPVSYLPISIWPPEEFLIDADGAYRLAYEGQFTLEELRAGSQESWDGHSARDYTVTQLTPETDFRAVYEQAVDIYWQRFGHAKLDQEFAAFARIREKARQEGR
ncbi:hypothetical protein HYV30_02410 [Candidatus Kaiserbacteria bacterium]|nr:hypothetical protein [Candidatus Kaiserbacteria bacterium]